MTRITSCLFKRTILLALAAGMFFSGVPARGEEFRAVGPIICPEKSAIEAGSAMDEYYLANAYEKGYCGFNADSKLALRWYLNAARNGHMLAQYRLGEIHFTGSGGAPDYPEAKKWFLAAAKQGHGLSQLRLGFLYAEGHFPGVTVNYAEAEKWFLAAALQDAGDARFRLGNFYHNYKNPPDFKKAALWLARAAEGGHRVAMFDLALLFKNGRGVDKNSERMLFWMKKAADLDLLSAQMTLSEAYAKGEDVPKDPLQSLTWTLKIAAQPAAAVPWINKAGDIFFEGWETVQKDYAKARMFYERAAARNDPHALARLGRLYLEGLGVAADRAKAVGYLNKAVARGSQEAKLLLIGKE